MLPDNAIFTPQGKSSSSGNKGSWLPMMYLNEQGEINFLGLGFFAVGITVGVLTIVHHIKSIQQMNEKDTRLTNLEQQMKELQSRKGIA